VDDVERWCVPGDYHVLEGICQNPLYMILSVEAGNGVGNLSDTLGWGDVGEMVVDYVAVYDQPKFRQAQSGLLR